MLTGVERVMPGYATSDPSAPAPTYEEVSTGETSYAEVVQIEYDPSITHYDELLNVFFASHDPTTSNRQGNDVGPQYRSVIFYTEEEERGEAEEYLRQLQTRHTAQIKTTLELLAHFYPAEDYHCDYFATHGSAPYCQVIIEPKVEKIKTMFADKIKK